MIDRKNNRSITQLRKQIASFTHLNSYALYSSNLQLLPQKPKDSIQKNNLLTINGGSSSIKFALYETGAALTQILSGSIENIGQPSVKLSFQTNNKKRKEITAIKTVGYNEAAIYLTNWLEKQDGFSAVKAIGHRIVHGMKHTKAEKITSRLIDTLKDIYPYDPEHLPVEIKLIELFTKRYPAWVQIACFDTAFHTSMPLVAKLLPIPRKYFALGIQRYGFHGLSYAYLMQELNSITGKSVMQEKIILAHLGNGASMAAIRNGKSIDTSMGFTPAAGLVMGTRSGDLDPGIAGYLMQSGKLSPKQFNHMINHASGLVGLSETSGDMKELIEKKNTDPRAAEAFDLFCYQAKKCIGSYAAALEGLDTLVFSGGIGEHSPAVRSQICDGLSFLGIELDEIKNMNNEAIISSATGKVTVRVIQTNEQLMIAEMVCKTMKYSVKSVRHASAK